MRAASAPDTLRIPEAVIRYSAGPGRAQASATASSTDRKRSARTAGSSCAPPRQNAWTPCGVITARSTVRRRMWGSLSRTGQPRCPAYPSHSASSTASAAGP
ncbi:MAG TPA: hypothetical protein VF612_12675 [Jatrophihabitans sp.]|uniref:hypothetical protein n=1 Tax=Jatrophihabitans sp. TaxID=1932789 RepID=UPI002F1D947B